MKINGKEAKQWMRVSMYEGRPQLSFVVDQKFLDAAASQIDAGNDYAIMSLPLSTGAKENEFVLRTISFPGEAGVQVCGTNLRGTWRKSKNAVAAK